MMFIDSLLKFVLLFNNMADKASILREAQKLLAKGQVEKAIIEGEKLVKLFPDSNTFNFLGDLYLKKGDRSKACATYHKTAKVFRDDGFSLKALAIYKKILNIDSSDADALCALGELNEEKNITADAIKFYLAAADSFFKAKKKDNALNIYGKILRLAPDNIPLRTKIAEIVTKHGFASEAAAAYREIGEQYEEKGDLEKAKDFLIRSLDVQPGNRKTMLDLSRIAEKTGDLDQAMNYVKIAIERTGESKDLLLRNAHLLTLKGALDEARRILEKVLESDPQDIEARKTHAELYLKQGNDDKAWELYDTLLDDMIVAEQLDEAREILITLRDKNPIEVCKKLVIIYRNTDDKAAARELMTMAETYESRGMMHDALTAYNEARVIQPDDQQIAEKVEAIRKQLQPEEQEMPEMSGMPEMGETAEAPEGPDIFTSPAETAKAPSEEVMTEIDVFLRYGLYDEARERLEALKMEQPDNIDVHLKLKTLYKNTQDTEQAVTECIVLAELYGRIGDDENRKAHIKEAYDLNPADPRLEGKLEEIEISAEEAAAQAAGPSAAAGSLNAYESDLTEAEFYSKQGFYQEAADIYERLLGEFPDNSELRAKLDEARNALSGAAPAAEEETEGMETLSFDDLLTESGSGGEPALDNEVLEVFEEFKKGLESQVEAGDTETHYNLGIAYKEMGLLDDAISTFQAAKNDPNFFVQASTMLGNCYMEKGLYSLAIDAFQGVLMKMDSNDDTAWSIKYDLAEAYEKEGKLKEALDYYTEVYGWNSGFRDVTEKVNALKKSLSPEEETAKPEKPKQPTKDKEESVPPKRKSRVSYI